MPQFLRPSADLVTTGWTTHTGATSNLFATINEAVADDTNFIRSPQSPTAAVYACSLSGATDPLSSLNHTVRVRLSTDVASGGEVLNFTMQIRQGYVNESTMGTLIAQFSQNSVSGTGWVTATYTLTGSQADAITNYNNLQLRVVVAKA